MKEINKTKLNIFKTNMKTFINDYILTLTLSELPAVFILLIISLIIGFPPIIILFGLSLVLTADVIALLIGTAISLVKSNTINLKENSKDITKQFPLEKENVKQEIFEHIKTIKNLLKQLQEDEKNKYIEDIQNNKNKLLENLGFKSLNDLNIDQINSDSLIMEFNTYLENIKKEILDKIYSSEIPTNAIDKNKSMVRTRKKKGL